MTESNSKQAKINISRGYNPMLYQDQNIISTLLKKKCKKKTTNERELSV